MYVILDTNQIHWDFRLQNANTQELLKGAPARDIVVCIPEVVLAEMSAHFRDEMKKVIEALRTARSGLDRLHASEDTTIPNINLNDEVERYKLWLIQHIEQSQVRVLYVASNELRLLFDKYIGRRSPFKERGDKEKAKREPFFDTLIWLSVVQLSREDSNQQIVMISSDSGFADPKDNLSLHPDLRADLGVPEIEAQSDGREQDVPKNTESAGRVQLFKDIETFIEH